jgi:hypothetical protein
MKRIVGLRETSERHKIKTSGQRLAADKLPTKKNKSRRTLEFLKPKVLWSWG